MENENSPYYLGNRLGKKPSMLVLKSDNKVFTVELPWDAGTPEMVHAFYSAMIGIEYEPVDIAETMIRIGNEELEALECMVGSRLEERQKEKDEL